MSNETAKVIEKQVELMELDLRVALQRLKVKEYRIRAEVLLARADIEESKLEKLEKQRN